MPSLTPDFFQWSVFRPGFVLHGIRPARGTPIQYNAMGQWIGLSLNTMPCLEAASRINYSMRAFEIKVRLRLCYLSVARPLPVWQRRSPISKGCRPHHLRRWLISAKANDTTKPPLKNGGIAVGWSLESTPMMNHKHPLGLLTFRPPTRRKIASHNPCGWLWLHPAR